MAKETLIRGVALRPNLDWVIDEYGDAGWARVMAQLPEQDRIVLRSIIAEDFYPVSLFDRFSHALVDALVGVDRAEIDRVFRAMGGHAALMHLGSPSAHRLKPASVEASIISAATLIESMYSGVHAQCEILGWSSSPNSRTIIFGLGALSYSAPRLCGWAEGGLEMLGLHDAHIVESGWEAGHDAADPLRFDTDWT